MWERVAAGDFLPSEHDPIDVAAWLQRLAVKLLEADDETDASKRRAGIVAAVGLAGKPDGYAQLRDLIDEPQWDFATINMKRGQFVREIVEAARNRNLLVGIYAVDDTKAHDLVRSLLPR